MYNANESKRKNSKTLLINHSCKLLESICEKFYCLKAVSTVELFFSVLKFNIRRIYSKINLEFLF